MQQSYKCLFSAYQFFGYAIVLVKQCVLNIRRCNSSLQSDVLHLLSEGQRLYGGTETSCSHLHPSIMELLGPLTEILKNKPTTNGIFFLPLMLCLPDEIKLYWKWSNAICCLLPNKLAVWGGEMRGGRCSHLRNSLKWMKGIRLGQMFLSVASGNSKIDWTCSGNGRFKWKLLAFDACDRHLTVGFADTRN